MLKLWHWFLLAPLYLGNTKTYTNLLKNTSYRNCSKELNENKGQHQVQHDMAAASQQGFTAIKFNSKS